jgi:hypothetical protein
LEVAEQAFGTPSARLLIGILADIEAFDSGSELIDFFQGELKTTGNESLSIPIGSEYVATLVAVGTELGS